MASSPNTGGVGDWGAQAPVSGQAPLQSSNPQISYTGSYGQPGNNFQSMGKGPQVAPQSNTSLQNMMPQGIPQQPMQQQQGLSPFGRLGQMGGIDGAPNPEYMAMMNRPDMRNEYNRRMNSRPNIWG